jgi:hypothetical protein
VSTEARKSPDALAGERLVAAAGRLIDKNSHVRTLGMAYTQATVTQATVQALVTILVQKGVLGEIELQNTLAAWYGKTSDYLERDGMVATPSPIAKPNGADW